MQHREWLYMTGMTLCAGVNVSGEDCGPWELARASASERGSRLVILSADAPEWAMAALRPNAGPARAMAPLR
jgi:hypothetical protein